MCEFWPAKLLWVDDGDTIDVRMPTSTGKWKQVRVRITGIQAMEQTVYNSSPFRRRGDCHALQATDRLEQLMRKSRGVVRLGAQDATSVAGRRARRSVAVKIRGEWLDVGSILVAEGHALWVSQRVEQAWNIDVQQARPAGSRGPPEPVGHQPLRRWARRAGPPAPARRLRPHGLRRLQHQRRAGHDPEPLAPT